MGPLADNGGPTETHALLPGSPAFDAGDPSFTTLPDLDQRGTGYERVHGAAIDIGAYELLLADGNLDGKVDGLDYLLWASQFGGGAPAVPAAETFDSVAFTPSNKELKGKEFQAREFQSKELAAIDLALADDYETGAMVADEPAVRQWQISRAIDSLLKKARDRRGDRA